jgi:hypothetical protein
VPRRYAAKKKGDKCHLKVRADSPFREGGVLNPKKITRLIGGSTTGERRENDFYPTPAKCTHDLLARVNFHWNVWEPAVGDGAIAEVLKSNQFQKFERVYTSDIHDYGYPMDEQRDFLTAQKQHYDFDNIITNPPFKIATEFVHRALKIAQHKVAIFQKLTFLEGIERYERLFSKYPLEWVLPYTRRVTFPKSGAKHGGMMCFAWFVFNHEYRGHPKLEWIV